MSIYDDIEPTEETLKWVKAEPSGHIGGHTMRIRWRVECRFCGKLLHRNTTDPNVRRCDCTDAEKRNQGG